MKKRIFLIYFIIQAFFHNSLSLLCQSLCVLPASFWRENHEFSKDYKHKISYPFNCRSTGETAELNLIFNNTAYWHEVMDSRRRDICITTAQEVIAARLNMCNGACGSKEILGSIYILNEILDKNCRLDSVTKIKKRRDMDLLNEKKRFLQTYNTGGYINEMCKTRHEIDCNKNLIADYCEIKKNTLGNVCNKENTKIIVPGARLCRMDGISEREFCQRFRDIPDGKDCNLNGILDECEISSNSDISCESSLCIGKGSIERTPLTCLSCKSEDSNFNEIPDICEDAYSIKQQFSGIIDCNKNGIDDYADILLKSSSDINLNGIPDECEIGSCCDDGECFETSLPKCKKNEHFQRDVPCSQRKDCFKLSKLEIPGSCCRRTDSIDTFLFCENGVSFLECEEMHGKYSKFPCGNGKCTHSIGNCCSSIRNSNNNDCLKTVTWEFCSEYYKNFIFDFKHCEDPLNLCTANETTFGTCTLNGNCLTEIKKEVCIQLNGFFDTLPCRYRKDSNSRSMGSCCFLDELQKCIDLISDRECFSRNGSFSLKTCEKRHYCLPSEKIPTCCYKEKTQECYDSSNLVCNTDPEMKKIFCAEHPICKIRMHASNGCCIIKEEDIIDIKEESCVFFGGTWINSTQCFDEKFIRKFPELVLDVPENIILQNKSIELVDDDNNNNENKKTVSRNYLNELKSSISKNSNLKAYAISMIVASSLFLISIILVIIIIWKRGKGEKDVNDENHEKTGKFQQFFKKNKIK